MFKNQTEEKNGMLKRSLYRQKWYVEEYDQDRYGEGFGERLHEIEVETYLSMIDGSQGVVLDVGAGTGKLTLPIMQRFQQVISLDTSPEMLDIAKRKIEKENLILKPVVCDAENLCFKDNAFENVVSSRVLMHLGDWRKGLRELCRVTNSSVVFDFPPLQGFSGLESLFKRLIKHFIPGTRAYKAFFVGSVHRELQKHDFRVVATKKLFVMPIAFHRWLNKPFLSFKIESFLRGIGLSSMIGAPVTIKAIKRGRKGFRQ